MDFLKKNGINVGGVFTKSIKTIIIRFFGLFLSVGFSIILARSIGPEGMGLISLSEKISLVVLAIILFGTKGLSLKKVAIFKSKSGGNNIKELLLDCFFVILVIFLFFFIVVNVFDFMISPLLDNQNLLYPLKIFVALTLFQAVAELGSSTLFGLNAPIEAIVLSGPLNSIFRIFFIVILFSLGLSHEIRWVTNVFLAAYFCTACYAVFSVMKKLKNIPLNYTLKKSRFKSLVSESYPFMWVSLIVIVSTNLDTIILGVLVDVEEIGYYAIASRITVLLSVFLATINSMLFSKIAVLIDENSPRDLEALLQKVNVLFWGVAICVFFFLFFFGKTILGFWGDAFVNGYLILIVLTAGYCIDMMTGCVGGVLMMGGFEKLMIKISSLMLVLNFILSFLLVSEFGVLGAAISTSFCRALENVIRFCFVKQKFGINMLPRIQI